LGLGAGGNGGVMQCAWP